MTLKYYLTEKAKKLETREHKFIAEPRPGDAGYDLQSAEDTVIYAGEQLTVSTGVHVSIPQGYVGIIKDRSSVAAKGVHVLAGVIDSTYRGEIKVVLINLSKSYYRINLFDKIAQMVIVPHLSLSLEQVAGLAELGTTVRGSGGFGSTGK